MDTPSYKTRLSSTVPAPETQTALQGWIAANTELDWDYRNITVGIENGGKSLCLLIDCNGPIYYARLVEHLLTSGYTDTTGNGVRFAPPVV